MKHSVLYWDETRYSAFPGLAKGEGDELWVDFEWNSHTPLARGPQGAVLSHGGALKGGASGHVELFSPDGGVSWFEEGKDDGFRSCPDTLRSTVLSDGTQIRVSRPQDVFSDKRREEFAGRGLKLEDLPSGRFRAENRLELARNGAGDDHWECRELVSGRELPFFALIRIGVDLTGCVLPNDTIVQQAYGSAAAGEPYRAWVLRSEDGGDTWQMVTMACDGGVHPFNESSLLRLPTGRIVALVRTASASKRVDEEEKYLWQTHSDDDGRTWSPAQKTPMWGYPPNLLLLRNGDVLCSYGHRRPPFGVRACLSRDGCETWDVDAEIVLRADGLTTNGAVVGKGDSPDLGYPRTVEFADGSLFTVYYLTLGDGVTHVAATKWTL